MDESATPNQPKQIEVLPGVFVGLRQRVKVVRVLEFEGPADWIKATLTMRWLQKGRPMETETRLRPDTRAEEMSLVLQVEP